MGGRSGQNKGKGGEREVVKLLQPIVNTVYAEKGEPAPKLQRNTIQSDCGGHDIVGLPWIALEVKRQEKLQLSTWWEQTRKQAGPNQIPVLLWRQSRQSWRVMMPVVLEAGREMIDTAAEVHINAFLMWFEDMLRYELGVEQFLTKEARDVARYQLAAQALTRLGIRRQ